MRSTLLRVLPLLGICLLVLGVFGRLVARPDALLVDARAISVDDGIKPEDRSPGNDLTRLFLPHHLRIAAEVRRFGRPCAWDVAGFGGRPRVGNPQAGLWYPPVWLVWWSGSPSSLGWLTVAHLIGAGIGVYALARSLGLGRGASLVGAGCVVASPYGLAQVGEGHLPHVWAACWYPWAFLAFLGWRRTGSVLSALTLPPILALCLLTGHPQEVYYLIVALSLWVVAAEIPWRAWRSRGRWRSAGRSARLWATLLALTLGLTAIEWIPVMPAQRWTLPATTMTFGQAGHYHLDFWNLLQLISPRALGGPSTYIGFRNYWETVLGIGWGALILASLAVARSPQRALIRPWLWLLLGAIAFAAGKGLGVFPLLYELVPGMDRFRVPARSLFLATLAAGLLAGAGIETLREPTGTVDVRAFFRRYARLSALLTILVLLGAWASSRADLGSSEDLGRLLEASRRIVSDPVFWVAMIGCAGLLGVVAFRPSAAGRAVIGLGLIAVGELFWYGFAGVRTTPAGAILADDPITRVIQAHAPESAFRIRARDAFFTDLNAVAAGLEKTNLNDSFQIRHAADLYERLYPQFDPPWPRERESPNLARANRAIRLAALDRLGVAFVVTDRPPTDPLPWPVLAGRDRQGRACLVYRHPAPLPRAYVVPRAEPCPEAVAVASMPYVPPREAVLMPSDPLGPVAGPRQPFTVAEVDRPGPDRLTVRVATEAPGLLVIAETWMPGWTASIEGRQVPILRGDRAWRVIPLPRAGSHRVELRYDPPGLREGMSLSAVSGLIWLTALGIALRFRARREDAATEKSEPNR